MPESTMSPYPILDFHGQATANEVDVASLTGAMKSSGAIILRNLVSHQSEFLQLTRRIAPGAVRGVIPSESSLEFHGELYYTPQPPDILWFYCVEPAAIGGQTLLVDGVAIVNDMKPDTRRFFVEHPLVYTRLLTPAQWKRRFAVETKKAVFDGLDPDASVSVKFEGDLLHTEFRTNAIRRTKWGGQPAFVNSLLHALDSKRRSDIGDYGLRTSIKAAILSELQGITWNHAYAIQWQQGDVALVDNTRVMHGRRTFKGRRVIIAVNGNALF